jgi:hypothetical protein
MALRRLARAAVGTVLEGMGPEASLLSRGLPQATLNRIHTTAAQSSYSQPSDREIFTRHQPVQDLGDRKVDGANGMYVVIHPGATVIGDVDISVRVSLFSSDGVGAEGGCRDRDDVQSEKAAVFVLHSPPPSISPPPLPHLFLSHKHPSPVPPLLPPSRR